MRLPNWELEKLRMEHEEKEAEQARQRAEEQYWKKLEHQYAGMAMQGIVSNPSIELDYKGDEGCIHAVAIVAGKFAHALVEKLKESK